MKKVSALFLFALITLQGIAQLPAKWQSIGIGGGGAMFCPSLSPHNDSDMWITCDMSDLFHSRNQGATWQTVDFRQVASSSPTKVCYTSNPGILYTIRYNDNGGNAVKSTDGGITWNKLAGWSSYAYEIFSDVHDSLRLIVADYDNAYYTRDGGKNFKKIYSHPNCHIAGVFFDSNSIYIATKSGLLTSADGGKSFSLSPVSGIPVAEQMYSFAGAKQNSFTRFYCVTADSSDVYPAELTIDYSVYRGVYKLDQGSKSWKTDTAGIHSADGKVLYCGMALNDTSTVYLGGSWTPAPYSFGNPYILKKINSGLWKNIMAVGEYQTTGQNQNVYTAYTGYKGDYPWYNSAPIGFNVSPSNSNCVIFTGMGDCNFTNDGGKYWRQLYEDTADNNAPFKPTPQGKSYHSNGLEVTGCWWINWSDSNNIFAGYTDIRGTRSTDGGQSWSFDYKGHDLNTMYHVITHPLNGYMYAATSGIHDMYKSTKLTDGQINPGANNYEAGKVIYSPDKGANWKTLYDFGHPVIRLAIDPNNTKRLYAAVIHHGSASVAGGIYVCNDIIDSAAAWHLLPAPPRTEGHPYDLHILKDGSLVCTYSARRDAKGFTASSGVFYMPKGTGTWKDVSDKNMQWYTKDIIIDPYDTTQNTWIVCVNNGWGGNPNDRGGLYRTKDRGASWTRLTPSAEPDVWNMNFESVTISPYNKDEMYATTSDHGLWHTDDLTDSIPTFNWVMEYPFASPQRVFYHPYHKNEIWISSFGNGIRKGIIPTVTAVRQNILLAPTVLEVYPNPASQIVNIRFTTAINTPVTITIYDALGRVKAIPYKSGNNSGVQNVIWNAADLPEGVYFIELAGDGGKKTAKLVLEK